jgi:segregation and condensation protein A
LLEHNVDAHEDSQLEQGYRVRLDVFEGPLDVLLRLIEKQELDITKVSLLAVTDQYLEFISHLEHLEPGILADFLVIAAKLLLIKSRALLPAPPALPEGDAEDVGDDLVQQLREYKLLKGLAQQLRQREESGLRAYLRVASLPQLEKKLDLSDVTLDDLLDAVREVLAVQAPVPAADEVVSPVTITIGDKIQAIERLLARRGSFGFRLLLRKATSRSEVIVTFLALLELIKAGRVAVQQEKLFGEIMIARVQETAPQPASQEHPQE